MLPEISHPSFPFTLPVSKKEVELRPMTVKEEKLLLFVDPSDLKALNSALAKVIEACSITPIKALEQCQPDFDYLALMIRSISTNNKVPVSVDIPDAEGVSVKYDQIIDLNNFKLSESKSKTKDIAIGDGWKIKLRYPSVALFPIPEDPNLLIAEMIDVVYNKTESYKFSDYAGEEVEKFIDNLSTKATLAISEFYGTMPHLYYELKCGDRVIELAGLSNFFR